MPAQVVSDFGLLIFVGRDRDEKPLVVLLGHRKLVAVHEQEDVACLTGGPLVSVYVRMIERDVKYVCRRHREEIAVDVRAVEALLRHVHRSIERVIIPDTWDAAVLGDLLVVDLIHLSDGEKERIGTTPEQVACTRGRTSDASSCAHQQTAEHAERRRQEK